MKFTFLFLNLAKIHIFIPKSAYCLEKYSLFFISTLILSSFGQVSSVVGRGHTSSPLAADITHWPEESITNLEGSWPLGPQRTNRQNDWLVGLVYWFTLTKMRTMSSNTNTNTTELIKIWRSKINVNESFNWLLTIIFWEGKRGASWWRLETTLCATDGICRSLINIKYWILYIEYYILNVKY